MLSVQEEKEARSLVVSNFVLPLRGLSDRWSSVPITRKILRPVVYQLLLRLQPSSFTPSTISRGLATSQYTFEQFPAWSSPMMFVRRALEACERRRRHNGIEHRDSSRGYSETAHRSLVAHRAGACAYRDRLCRECVPARAPQRKSAGCKSPALQLLHCNGRRVVWGFPSLASAPTPRARYGQSGFRALADTPSFLQRLRACDRIYDCRGPASRRSGLLSWG